MTQHNPTATYPQKCFYGVALHNDGSACRYSSIGGYTLAYYTSDSVFCPDCALKAQQKGEETNALLDLDGTVLLEGYHTCDDCHKVMLGAYSDCEDNGFAGSDTREEILDGCTAYWSEKHLNASRHMVVIVHRDRSPWADRPYAVLCSHNGAFYDGEYDLTLEEAIEERDRRSHSLSSE